MARTEIQAKLGLDTTAFQRGLAKSQKGISNFVAKGIKRFGALAGAAGLGAMAKAAIDVSKEISNLAKVANSSEEELQKIAFGANTVGVSMEKTADIMKDVSDKVGDFLQTGGGPLKDFFENIAPKVGVTAEQFRNLSGPQSLQLYVSSLEKANLSQNEMTFFMEAIASDATLLLPLMKDNGEAMKKFGDEAERAGQVMDKVTIEKLKKASVEIDQFKNRLVILTGKILAKAVPAFQVFSGGISFVSSGLAFLVLSLKSFTTFLGTSFAIVMQPAISNLQAFGKAIEAAAQAATGNFSDAKQAILEAKKLSVGAFSELLTIPDQISTEFSDMRSDMSDNVELMTDDFEGAASTIGNAFKGTFQGISNDAGTAANNVKEMGSEFAETGKVATEAGEAVSETGEAAEKATTSIGEMSRGFNKAKTEANGLLTIARQISAALGIDANVKGKGTDILRRELDFTKAQLLEIKRFADKNRTLGGKTPLSVKLEQAQVQAQFDRIQAELADRERFRAVSGRGATGLVAEGFTIQDVQRMETFRQDGESTDMQNDLLSRIQAGIEGINNTTSKLDRNLTG